MRGGLSIFTRDSRCATSRSARGSLWSTMPSVDSRVTVRTDRTSSSAVKARNERLANNTLTFTPLLRTEVLSTTPSASSKYATSPALSAIRLISISVRSRSPASRTNKRRYSSMSPNSLWAWARKRSRSFWRLAIRACTSTTPLLAWYCASDRFKRWCVSAGEWVRTRFTAMLYVVRNAELNRNVLLMATAATWSNDTN